MSADNREIREKITQAVVLLKQAWAMTDEELLKADIDYAIESVEDAFWRTSTDGASYENLREEIRKAMS